LADFGVGRKANAYTTKVAGDAWTSADEIIPYGRLCKLDFMKIIERLKDRPNGKYIEVTGITPTHRGEGKQLLQ